MIGVVLYLARDFSNNHKPRQCKKINKLKKKQSYQQITFETHLKTALK